MRSHTNGDPMIEILLQKLPTYVGFLLLAGGLICFFIFKYASDKRDSAFRREAEILRNALDAERRKHAKMYSVHREMERRNIFNDSTENNKSSN